MLCSPRKVPFRIDRPYPLDKKREYSCNASMKIVLTNQIVQVCSREFLNHPNYAFADQAIKKVISAIPTHSELSDALAKVAIIKTLYATTLYDTLRMAKHICSIKNIDALLSAGSPDVVDRIRKGHSIISKKYKREIDFYSFATKYCSFHNRRMYPIYDTLVAALIKSVLRNTNDLRNYKEFIAAIDQVRLEFSINLPTYKEIDMGLWVYAKYLNNIKKPTENDLEKVFFSKVAVRIAELNEE
jgi:hypothetical protein